MKMINGGTAIRKTRAEALQAAKDIITRFLEPFAHRPGHWEYQGNKVRYVSSDLKVQMSVHVDPRWNI